MHRSSVTFANTLGASEGHDILIMKNYPRYLKPGFKSFDPLELARATNELVSRKSLRKYTDFYKVGAYGGIATGFLVGCCLRCPFCWVGWSRDFPEKHGQHYSPQQVFNRLDNIARRKRIGLLRISGGEPTLNRLHLLELLDLVDPLGLVFILETNGLLIGNDRAYAEDLAKYDNLYIRVSIKAGDAWGFERRTGALGDFFDLPYKAVEYLLELGTDIRVACMSDPRVMPHKERLSMIRRLERIGYCDYLEEEDCSPYPTAVARMRYAGYDIFKERNGEK